MLLDGQWSPHENGYALKLGDIFFGYVSQRGGDSIYGRCWIVSLNRKRVDETHDDLDYAKAIVERLICDELERIVPAYKQIRARVPPRECFWGQDHSSQWKNWKEDKAVEGWTFVAPTLRQIQAALKRKGQP